MLYNGLEFPDYIFTNKVNSSFFLDFDIVFIDEKFWEAMKRLLKKYVVNKIRVQNLKPDYPFDNEIEVSGLPESFIRLVKTMNLPGYFSDSASIHMITDKMLIYSSDVEDSFCILLTRDYSISIVGFAGHESFDEFADYRIENISEYLAQIAFGSRGYVPADIQEKLSLNWDIKPGTSGG